MEHYTALPEGEHGEQRADRVHAVRVAVRRVRVCGAGGADQGDHRPVHPQPGRVQEDIRQHQPVHDPDAGRSSQLKISHSKIFALELMCRILSIKAQITITGRAVELCNTSYLSVHFSVGVCWCSCLQ